MAEFGKVHRYEPSGALHGLLRVRHFTQDDAHIFCTEEQIEQECKDVVALIIDIYKDFGFDNVRIKLSTRPEKRIGSDETWDKLEGALACIDGIEVVRPIRGAHPQCRTPKSSASTTAETPSASTGDPEPS